MALFKLLAGHVGRYRRAELLDSAVHLSLDGGPRRNYAVSLLNATLLCRRFMHLHVVLGARQLASRARYLTRGRAAAATGPIPRAPSGAAARTPRTLSLLCPTRTRVRNVASFLRSIRKTARHPERIEVLFYVDEDDPAREAYVAYFRRAARANRRLLRCEPIVGPPIGVSRSWDALARASTGDILMLQNDDQIYVDYAWDETLDRTCDRFPDGIVCMFFDAKRYDNEIEGLPRGDFPAVTRTWYETLGYFTPSLFEFWCGELWILDIAKRIGRLHAIPGVFVDHLHYDAYKSPFDETYLRRHRNEGAAERDRALYANTVAQRFKAAVKLMHVIGSAK